jgi:hypothetical protein
MLVPKNGLIIDVRGNGGGYINFAERILQFLTPKEITLEPYSAISTPVTLDMSQKGGDLNLGNHLSLKLVLLDQFSLEVSLLLA